MAIRDIVLGSLRKEVCERYGVSRETLRHWVFWYNKNGILGLRDEQRSGRPRLLSDEKLQSFKERIEKQPCQEKDGLVRWRAVDIKKILEEEYDVEYTSLFGVRKLCHSLGLSFVTTRPKHPRQDAEVIAAFKKTPEHTRRDKTKTSR
jgi:transposase